MIYHKNELMNKFPYLPTLTLMFLSFLATAQVVEVDKTAYKRMERDLFFLSSDSLKGRLPGSFGADVARDFIVNRMSEYGLEPLGDRGYLQPFPVPERATVNYDMTGMILGRKILKGHIDFYPVAYSANGEVLGKTVYVGYGIVNTEGTYDDYLGKYIEGNIVVMNVSAPDGVHPHSAYAAYHSLSERITLAKNKGASAVILINPEETASDTPEFFKSIKSLDLPVVFVRNHVWEKKLTKKSVKVTLKIDMKERNSVGYNVAGYIHNNKPQTVVLGAHYDHIGMGLENSLYKGEPAIHNGADDNGSGTTMLLEMMGYYGTRKDTNYNYLMLFFSAEESGLIGSKYYVAHPTLPLQKVAYMINFDMVGRLREDRFQLSGTGTAAEWDALLEEPIHNLIIKKDPSGVGPSDHTSFYYKDLPVLHLFTGTHEDYHKPSDDAEKVNFKGMSTLTSFVYSITARTAAYERLTFQPTKGAEQNTSPRFSVTLGVIPDYLHGGPGLRIDGATQGRTAANAGLQSGDVILKIGAMTIDDIYAYMGALGAFKKGDTTTLIYEREGESITTEITF